jgi:hypothetical protein
VVERWTGEIVSDAVRHRYETKLDAVTRKRIEKVRSAEARREAGQER